MNKVIPWGGTEDGLAPLGLSLVTEADGAQFWTGDEVVLLATILPLMSWQLWTKSSSSRLVVTASSETMNLSPGIILIINF
jgi:hypothetical protein